MIYINEENSLVIKSWCNNVEEGAIAQAKNLARLPFAFRQICLMPDAHQGYGMPIGGVMATQDVIVPNAVGVDIGCGMCAVRTSLTDISIESLKFVLKGIRERTPVGFNKHPHYTHQELGSMPLTAHFLSTLKDSVVDREFGNALVSLGTLGGGNHFIEIQKGDGRIWIMIHSGSRNLGKQVADHYNKKAIELNERYFSKVPKEWQLAFLPVDSQEGQAYQTEMQYCVDFAFKNRSLMMERIKQCFNEVVDDHIEFGDTINIAHNYARLENHFGKNVWVHRKGATSARLGETGIIPGSQGTSSYIVEGLGNPESFTSCSHGAGRAMGRKEAERTLNLEEEQKRLDDKGILHSVRGIHDLDEAAGAYKDIDVVMEEQKDLVKIITRLEPLAVVKG